MLVLTVDDSRTMRDMLQAALSPAGFDIVQANDGLHALEILETCKPDVIVTNINMPRMDGYDAGRACPGVRTDHDLAR